MKETINIITNRIFPINHTKKSVESVVDFIKNNQLFLPNLNSYIQENYEEIKYNRKTNQLNIPGNFIVFENNRALFEKAKDFYGENALNVMICHEFGHSVQHRFLKIKNSQNWDMGKYGEICLTQIGEYNPITENAQNFFKVNNNIPNGIERFMQRNFMESYADCYSGLITYLMSDKKNVFDQIKSYRNNRKEDIKKKKDFVTTSDYISNGKFATTEYDNIYGIEKFKDNFINNNKFSKDFILKLVKGNGFEAIHHIMQIEVLDGLYKTMKEEAKNNDLFLFELKDFCEKRHGLTINKFFEEFETHINNVRKVHCIYVPTNNLDNEQQFYDYDKASLTVSKEKIIQEYKQSLSSEGLKEFNKLGIKDIKLDCFNENYGIANYDLPIKLNNKKIISKNILNLREKFTELKEQNKNNFKLN